jgi:hypothetical protein
VKIYSKVIVHSTTDPKMDGQTATIVGVFSHYWEIDFWIIEWDNPPYPEKGKCSVLISSCLKEL